MIDRLARPVVCMVTDRRRLARPVPDALLRAVRTAAQAGVSLVQLRERDLPGAELLTLAGRVLDAIEGTGCTLVINDRVDVALSSGAGGVHLRGDSVDAARVRAIVPPHFLIGRSVHGVPEALAAAREGADYVTMGTVFPTSSKAPSAPLAGIARLREVCRAVRLPVLAIGGISADNLGDVAAAGAHGIAAIGLFSTLPADAAEARAAAGGLVDAVRRAFAKAASPRDELA